MKKLLHKIYKFLFIEHDVGFIRFAMIMLIPCALSIQVCRWWMMCMVFIQWLILYAHHEGWNRID